MTLMPLDVSTVHNDSVALENSRRCCRRRSASYVRKSRGETAMTQIRMRGAGYYGAHQPSLIIDRALPLILEALDALDPASSGTVFAIADFGAADGGTSIGLLRALLTELRARAPGRPVTLT